MKIQIKNATPQILKYGVNTPKFFENGIRYDSYISNKDGEEFIESTLVTGSDDLSPVQQGRPNLDNCHCCFANYGHSENLCKSKIN